MSSSSYPSAVQQPEQLWTEPTESHGDNGVVRKVPNLSYLQDALRRKPRDPEIYYRLGRALSKERRWDEAVLCYRQALHLKPDFISVHKHLGDALLKRRDATLDEAVSSYQEAIRLKPEDAGTYGKLGSALRDMGLVDEAISAFRRACQLRPESPGLYSKLLHALHFQPACDAATLAREHECWNKRYAEPLRPQIKPHGNDRDPNRRLRVGYLSAHFCSNAIGRSLLPLVAAHDRRNFEIHCYASVRVPDQITARLRIKTDSWHDIRDLTDDDLADGIRKDRIDILVDPDLHCGDRLLVFARKPAPVQVTYLAYCSTTGLTTMDYRLTDPFLDPVDQPLPYAEESVWLPETYWCYRPHMELPPVGPPPAPINGQVTFGCLNFFYKVTLPVLTVWRDLLRQVPNSRLLLQAEKGTHRDRVLTFFAEGGVAPTRIEFASLCPQAEYFQRYAEIDIALDPFPYGGGTTTCDALWMGVPVVSLVGDTAVGRGGLSILSNVGLPELVARTPEEYVRIAADLARDLERLAALRTGLRERMLNSPLMDVPRFACHVEAAFRTMWRRWCNRS